MSWLYFFMGVTAAWVFMGLFLLVSDKVKLKEINKTPEDLLVYWENSERLKKQELSLLAEIAEAIEEIDK